VRPATQPISIEVSPARRQRPPFSTEVKAACVDVDSNNGKKVATAAELLWHRQFVTVFVVTLELQNFHEVVPKYKDGLRSSFCSMSYSWMDRQAYR